jgi:ubiquinone/menaquinone biosynthesis C-methylase UbiE
VTTNDVISAAFYDDPDFNYQDYWANRGYEHQAEVIAIRRLLKGRQFGHAVDIGGGYGRLAIVLSEFADQITLVDSSNQQLALADAFLAGYPQVAKRQMDAANLGFPDTSIDLITLIRVLHHLPEPAAELAESYRVLRPGGHAIVEVANLAHALNRLRCMARLKSLPIAPVDIRSAENKQRDGIAFVNHHPAAFRRQIQAAGLQIERVLSVSNLRHRVFKKALPERMRLAAERIAQPSLAQLQFGPSLFFLLRK